MSNDFYGDGYEKLLYSGAIGFASKLVHKSLENFDLSQAPNRIDTVLELGAGHGQHFSYVKHDFNTYFETDIRLENLPNRRSNLFVNSDGSKRRVIKMRMDAQNLESVQSNSIDRLIAGCLLIHLQDPEGALREWKRVIKEEGGILSIYIPCEPGLLLRSLRQMTTVRKAKKSGIKHLSFHYREHIGHFPRMDLLIKEVFYDFRIRRNFFPSFFPSWNSNLWCTYQISSSAENSDESKLHRITS